MPNYENRHERPVQPLCGCNRSHGKRDDGSYTPIIADYLYFRRNGRKGQAAAEDCGPERQLKRAVSASHPP